MGFIQDFKKFALKGNVVDLAVAVVIGAAFGKIVTSLVNDIIMPPLGYLMGGIDYKNYVYVLRQAREGVEAVTINYGMFFQNVLDFLIIAMAIFVVIRAYQKLEKKKEVEDPPKATLSKQEELLMEIRDLLKK